MKEPGSPAADPRNHTASAPVTTADLNAIARPSPAGQHPAASYEIHGKPAKSLQRPQVTAGDRSFRVDLGVAGCQQEAQGALGVQSKGRDLPLPFCRGLGDLRLLAGPAHLS